MEASGGLFGANRNACIEWEVVNRFRARLICRRVPGGSRFLLSLRGVAQNSPRLYRDEIVIDAPA